MEFIIDVIQLPAVITLIEEPTLYEPRRKKFPTGIHLSLSCSFVPTIRHLKTGRIKCQQNPNAVMPTYLNVHPLQWNAPTLPASTIRSHILSLDPQLTYHPSLFATNKYSQRCRGSHLSAISARVKSSYPSWSHDCSQSPGRQAKRSQASWDSS